MKSLLAETEIRGLIDRVRSGGRKEHPHRKAMARLMPDRHEGVSFNLGALKPVLGMAAMFAPEAAQLVMYMPDDLWLSTALAVRDGHIHIRGDWPLMEIAAFAERVEKLAK